MARRQGSLHIGAVVGVHVHRIVRPGAAGSIDELAHHLIAVRAAGVLGADGYLPLGALQPLAHAAHIHADGLRHPLRDIGSAAVAHLLVHRHMEVHMALGDCAGVLKVLGQTQQDAHR